MPADVPNQPVVEYQIQEARPKATAGEVVIGTVMAMVAGVCGLLAAGSVAVAVVPGFREEVGWTPIIMTSVFFGAVSLFSARFSLELFRGRKRHSD